MDAKELRIGNYVLAEVGLPSLDTVSLCSKDIYDYECRLIKIYPIPLTEEWLVKLGFEYCELDEVYHKMYFELQYWSHNNTYHYVTNRGCLDMQIQYVHQLQNLYFALTGEELTLK